MEDPNSNGNGAPSPFCHVGCCYNGKPLLNARHLSASLEAARVSHVMRTNDDSGQGDRPPPHALATMLTVYEEDVDVAMGLVAALVAQAMNNNKSRLS